jgi:hypothetical protein
MKYLLDPRFFNILILILFAAAAVRWGIARNWPQCTYWAAALVLNIAVTMMAQPAGANG